MVAALALGACGTPYALDTSSIDYDRIQTPGSIMITDPKLYKREALINERRDEIAYLDDLLKQSKTLTFTPEIVRELEVVTALSASLGLKFDPAAGANYRNARELSDTQQEIQGLRLQMELAQLKKDVELFQTKLTSQTAVSNTSLGAASTTAVMPVTSDVQAQAVTDLAGAISGLQSRLDVVGKGALSASGVATNPIDTFQDRAAYRSLLNSARNASSLDELHDRNGSALIRLYFSATVLPPRKEELSTLGILRMTVIPPSWNYADTAAAYRIWLDYLNREMNVECPLESCTPSAAPAPVKLARGRQAAGTAAPQAIVPRFYENPVLTGLSATPDMFDKVYYQYDKKAGAGCDGVSFALPVETGTCGVLTFVAALPIVLDNLRSDTDSLREVFGGAIDLKGNFPLYSDAIAKVKAEVARMRGVRAQKQRPASPYLDAACGPNMVSLKGILVAENTGVTMDVMLSDALRTYFLTKTITQIDLQAQKFLMQHDRFQAAQSHSQEGIAPRSRMAMALLQAFSELSVEVGDPDAPGCAFSPDNYVFQKVPYRFIDALREDARVAIYEVGPRERVQQMSSTARAADAIGLAAAIAGQIPSSGIGANGNIAYARSATGKADMLERVPLVVSFAEAREQQPESAAAFGWLLGPRVSLEAGRKQLVLRQQLKPYDLSVDLAVPGWWPYLRLETQTAWAPDWQSGNGATLRFPSDSKAAATGDRAAPQPGLQHKTIKVDLAPNSSDLTALTSRIAGAANTRWVSISDIFPRTLSACAPETQVQITGENVWRASMVAIGGQKFEGDAIRVLPDMSGVVVTVPGSALARQESGGTRLFVLTPYGRQSREGITIKDVEKAPKCETAEKAAAAAKAPTIKAVAMTASPCVANAAFRVTGANLSGIEAAALGDLKGTVSELAPKNGTVVQAAFPGPALRATFAGVESAELVLGKASKTVKLNLPATCPQ